MAGRAELSRDTLDRTQRGPPLKRGRCGTMTHDYKRHGTTALFAAMNVLDRRVIGRCMQRHRHQEFIRFLNAVEAEIDPSRQTGPCDRRQLRNHAAHKHPICYNGSLAPSLDLSLHAHLGIVDQRGRRLLPPS